MPRQKFCSLEILPQRRRDDHFSIDARTICSGVFSQSPWVGPVTDEHSMNQVLLCAVCDKDHPAVIEELGADAGGPTQRPLRAVVVR